MIPKTILAFSFEKNTILEREKLKKFFSGKESFRESRNRQPIGQPLAEARQAPFKGRRLLIQKGFCKVYDYSRNKDLSKSCGNPERKFGVTTQIY